MDYTQLAALAAVCREGSFERAARVLHVTPSAISQRVKLLEQRMGAVLVSRGQPCEPTDTGRRLVRHAEHVALLENELHGALAGPAMPVLPVLRVAVNADSLATWFVPALAALAEALPQVQIELEIDDQDHTAKALRRGDVLAAVTASAEPVHPSSTPPPVFWLF